MKRISEKKSAAKRHPRRVKPIFKFNPEHTALPDEEVQWLVTRITTRGGVEPFVRLMVEISDDLKAGNSRRLAQAARRRGDAEFTELLTAMSGAVRQGRAMAAYHTAFYAASCAYQNSLDYLRALLGYLERFRRGHTDG
ncbi:MAG TPA: hypothetical protein VG148_12590 [Pyrinomonadaceae bacterium]|nr:hypothetical protein [Pyrinomonadaceae bacterium]